MHDFRSHSLDDAIERHVNQAEGTRRAFNGLSRTAQRPILTFLRSSRGRIRDMGYRCPVSRMPNRGIDGK